MKPISFFFLLSFQFIFLISSAQLSEQWRSTFYIHGTHSSVGLYESNDAVYIAATSSEYSNNQFWEYFLWKLNFQGVTEWNLTYSDGFQTYNALKDVFIYENDFIYLTGNSDGATKSILTTKFRTNGSLVWKRNNYCAWSCGGSFVLSDSLQTYVAGNADTASVYFYSNNSIPITKHEISTQVLIDNMIFAENNNIIVAGDSLKGTGINATRNFYLEKISNTGNRIWNISRDKGTNFMYYRPQKVKFHNGRIFLLTKRYNGQQQVQLLAYDTNGGFLWETTDTIFYRDLAVDLHIDSKGNIWYLVDKGTSSSVVRRGLGLYKYDPYGNLLSSYETYTDGLRVLDFAFDAHDYCYVVTTDTGKVSIHQFNSDAEHQWKVHVPDIKVDLYAPNYTSKPIDRLVIDSSNNLYLMGYMDSAGTQGIGTDIVVIKLNQDTVNVTTSLNSPHHLIYPNPNQGKFKISSHHHDNYFVELFNIEGIFIKNILVSKDTEVDFSSFTKPGLYLIVGKSSEGDLLFTEKMIVITGN